MNGGKEVWRREEDVFYTLEVGAERKGGCSGWSAALLQVRLGEWALEERRESSADSLPASLTRVVLTLLAFLLDSAPQLPSNS